MRLIESPRFSINEFGNSSIPFFCEARLPKERFDIICHLGISAMRDFINMGGLEFA